MMNGGLKETAVNEQSFLCPKSGKNGKCGDRIVKCVNFYAVIDGATPKGERLWDGLPGDVFVADVLERSILGLRRDVDAISAINSLNFSVREQYVSHGLEFLGLAPEERLQASVVLFSKARREIWSFGDCTFRVNGVTFMNRKKADGLMADLRAFCIEAETYGSEASSTPGSDAGREKILPFLRMMPLLANTEADFGYDVINGGEIRPEHTVIRSVRKGDLVVLASDGYPELFDTLEETERYLFSALAEDPGCTGVIRGTKGVLPGNESYDDRSYFRFTVG